MEPLGGYSPILEMPLGPLLSACAVLSASALVELSRTLAEKYRGRWFAGNGRDLFHAGAVGVVASGLLANGLPVALACMVAATVCAAPLLLIDDLPGARRVRLAVLLLLFAGASAPAVLAPRAVVSACNAAARGLF
jgi:hypothetical protein